jgi:uncharacterized protein with PQ loop repeat
MLNTTAASKPPPLRKASPLLERAVYLSAILGPFSSVPQIYAIWFVDTSPVGVSMTTWLLFLLISVLWLAYGIVRRDRPLIISNSIWIVLEVIIVVGAIRLTEGWR